MLTPLYHAKDGHRLIPGGHLEDLPACNRVAVLVDRRYDLTWGSVPVEGVRKLDLAKSQHGEPLVCGSCGAPVRIDWLSYEQPFVRRTIPRRSELKERWDGVV